MKKKTPGKHQFAGHEEGRGVNVNVRGSGRVIMRMGKVQKVLMEPIAPVSWVGRQMLDEVRWKKNNAQQSNIESCAQISILLY